MQTSTFLSQYLAFLHHEACNIHACTYISKYKVCSCRSLVLFSTVSTFDSIWSWTTVSELSLSFSMELYWMPAPRTHSCLCISGTRTVTMRQLLLIRFIHAECKVLLKFGFSRSIHNDIRKKVIGWFLKNLRYIINHPLDLEITFQIESLCCLLKLIMFRSSLWRNEWDIINRRCWWYQKQYMYALETCMQFFLCSVAFLNCIVNLLIWNINNAHNEWFILNGFINYRYVLYERWFIANDL